MAAPISTSEVPPHVLWLIGVIIGVVGTLNTLVLGYLATQIGRLSDKLAELVPDKLCKERMAKCANRNEDDHIWAAIDKIREKD